MEEKELTAEKAIEIVIEFIYAVSGLVALFALIWGRWYAFRCAVSVIVGLTIVCIAAYYITEKLKKR